MTHLNLEFDVAIVDVKSSIFFFDITPCSPLKVNRCFCCLIVFQWFVPLDHEDRGGMFLRNVG
jgi:hypothetical protein